MTEQELKALLQKGESETLEMKQAVPPPHQIAVNLASMANTEGGTLVLGVREPGQAVGINVDKAKAAIAAAQRHMAPPLEVKSEVVTIDGRPVVLAMVSRTPHLVSASGGYYKRVGDHTHALDAADIQAHAKAEKDDQKALSELSSAVATQTQVIDELRKDFAKANSPWRKFGWVIAGAIAGAIVKHVAGILLGG
ncbi:helix-turn-helix domain-containing protein [Caballeronia sp. S22]|uniref:AlbA family DNA-binding domain-containing protein n=1 Tax=Caballeronia sp. S22 TaxID=3137182 RepID=UPI0035305A76